MARVRIAVQEEEARREVRGIARGEDEGEQEPAVAEQRAGQRARLAPRLEPPYRRLVGEIRPRDQRLAEPLAVRARGDAPEVRDLEHCEAEQCERRGARPGAQLAAVDPREAREQQRHEDPRRRIGVGRERRERGARDEAPRAQEARRELPHREREQGRQAHRFEADAGEVQVPGRDREQRRRGEARRLAEERAAEQPGREDAEQAEGHRGQARRLGRAPEGQRERRARVLEYRLAHDARDPGELVGAQPRVEREALAGEVAACRRERARVRRDRDLVAEEARGRLAEAIEAKCGADEQDRDERRGGARAASPCAVGGSRGHGVGAWAAARGFATAAAARRA